MVIRGQKRKDRPPETACNVGGESSSTSNTFNSTPKWEHDVFLSFAGEDTRLNFTGHLYDAFIRSGIRCFKDNVDLPRGENINVLFRAIEDSLCSVLVISQNYAKSTWCLDELQKILESRNILDRWVFPIFYDVDPADVRNQRGSFGEALAELEERFRENTTKVQNWRTALSEIGNLSGWVTRGRDEADLIKNVVGDVWSFLSSKLPSFDDNLVGIDSKVAEVMPFLEIGLGDESFFVGIWGMGGLGKTTLARVVSEKLASKFDICCFLENVKDASPKDLVSLQKSLLSHLKIKDMEIHDGYKGMQMIRTLLCNKKVLLVLDDIDDKSQLTNLAGSPDWFGKGSRIIITTRDSQLLTSSGLDEQRIYELKTMKDDESLELFSNRAFGKDHPPEGDYLEYSKSVVKYVGSLPLALEVLGPFFYGKSKAEWISALDRLKQDRRKQIPFDDRIRKMLQISYDGLKHDEEKTIFLDIACFFKGWLRKEVTQILKSCDFQPIIGIKVLIEKALLVERKDGRLEMHDLLEDLGRYIVRQESPDNVGKRSRLWKFEDIKEVLENNKGSNAIQAIGLPYYWSAAKITVHPEAFSKMSSIRLLLSNERRTRLILPPGFKLPSTLKVVHWQFFPFRALPLEIPANELVHVQPMKMRFIDLSKSEDFIETPDFSGVPCLEHLCLRSCTSLVKVHPSIGELKELVEVDLHGCINLETLPMKLRTNSLVKLDLGGCKKVVELPKFGKVMKKLSYLDVSKAAITRLPKSFGSLTGLTDLNLSQCGLNDESIPDDFGSLSSLIILDLSGNDFVNLPIACFSSLFRLLFLSLDCCGKLKSLPRLPPRLMRLNAFECDSMESLSSDSQLWNLVASLDREYRRQTKYVISDDEKYDDTPSMFKHIELEQLPLRDFFATIPGCKIPSWFPNTYGPSLVSHEHVIEVKIPSHLRDVEWSGIVLCLHFSYFFRGLISWSSKAPEDYDYIRREWAHRSTSWRGRLFIMVLELNQKTCWQDLKARDNSLHIKLYTHYQTVFPPNPMDNLKCGCRVISKEEIKEWCHLNDFNQLIPPQLAPPHDEVKLPLRVLDKFNGSVYENWGEKRSVWEQL